MPLAQDLLSPPEIPGQARDDRVVLPGMTVLRFCHPEFELAAHAFGPGSSFAS